MNSSSSAAVSNSVNKDHRTLHLTPLEVWQRQEQQTGYQPEAFDSDGFIHCTDDANELMNAGNRYYQTDCREYVALTISCDRLTVPVIYVDPDRRFPHIHGALNVSAVERVQRVLRTAAGNFVALER